MHIIVDGYNLIRQSESLQRSGKLSLQEERTELICRLSRFKKERGHRVTIVFDGWMSGPHREERISEKGITVIYSKRGEKADEVIKRIVKNAKGKVVVVTSDRDIIDTVNKNGAVAISSPEFESKITMFELDIFSYTMLSADDDHDGAPGIYRKKKGPSKRLSREKRRQAARLKKL